MTVMMNAMTFCVDSVVITILTMMMLCVLTRNSLPKKEYEVENADVTFESLIELDYVEKAVATTLKMETMTVTAGLTEKISLTIVILRVTSWLYTIML